MAANRIKTVEYMLPMTTASIARGTTYTDSADITVYIPETTSRAFLSCTIEMVAVMDTFTNSADPNGFGVRASCDSGVNWTAVTHGAMYTETDENLSIVITADVTAEFTARFAGASDTVRWGWYINADATGPTYNNVSGRLIITYEYDDTAHNTRVKTVRIPIESFNGRLTTTPAEIRQGTIVNQLPALKHASTPFLPEDTTVLRQVFLEAWINTLPNDVTDNTLTLRIDTTGATLTSGNIDNTQDTSLPFRLMWDLTAIDWTSEHALYGYTSASTCCGFVGGWLTVTYEYNHSASETILNSLLLGFAEDTTDVRVVGDKSMWNLERYIEEPDTIALKQSGVLFWYQHIDTSDTFSIKVGSQTVTGYTPTADGQSAGGNCLMHRIDAGGYRGAGITLARGENIFTVEWYCGTAGRISNVSALMILNYTSGKSTSGDGVHAHTTHFNIFASNRNSAADTGAVANVRVPKIIEANYWLMSVCPYIYAGGAGQSPFPVCVQAERASGEGVGAGWEDIFNTVATAIAERGFVLMHGKARSQFKRWPSDTDASRLNIEQTRSWRIAGATAQWALGLWITYHSHTWTISGTVSGYADADGAGLTVRFFRVSDGLCIGTTTTTTGGAYSITWYDNTEDMRAICEEDSTHVGCSVKGMAS